MYPWLQCMLTERSRVQLLGFELVAAAGRLEAAGCGV